MPWQHRQTLVDFAYQAEVDASSDERLVWTDSYSSLTISTVRAGDGRRYRLRPGQWMYVDVLTEHNFLARARSGISKSNCDHFLADQVMPRVIADTGKLVLHAGAVRILDAAILLIGPSGRGKSTLSASFASTDTPLLGDDAIIISFPNDRPCAETVYPSLRLLPDSLAAVVPQGTSGTIVADYTEKQRVALPDSTPVSLPVQAAFILSPPGTRATITIRPLSAADACMAFVESSFALDPSDTARARDRMEQASALARQVPAFEISYPRDFSRLPEVRQTILDQLVALEPA